MEHQGEYPAWGLTLSEVDGHDFFTESYKNIYYADGSKLPYLIHLQLPAIGLMADLGVTVKLTEQINLMVGAFFNYTCNNVRTDETTEMGWRADGYSGELAYRNHDFMNSYSGMIASEYVKAVRPWEVGLKIGIDWRHKPKEKAPQVEYERIQICDTTITLQQRVDTVHKPKPEVVKQIVRLMETSVIWYDLDSTEPKLKPADILDKIAAILIENRREVLVLSVIHEGGQLRFPLAGLTTSYIISRLGLWNRIILQVRKDTTVYLHYLSIWEGVVLYLGMAAKSRCHTRD